MASSTPETPSNGNMVEEKFDEQVILISTTFLVIIILMALFGNVLVVIAFAVFQKLRSMTNYFIVSLAVADILVAAVSMPVWVAYLLTGPAWMFDLWLQQVLNSFTFLILFSRIWIFLTILNLRPKPIRWASSKYTGTTLIRHWSKKKHDCFRLNACGRGRQLSHHVKLRETVLDFEFHAVGFRIPGNGSGFIVSGTWIPNSKR